jgi:uroporphyrinogen-III synthase/uroporphyrinogen III methyltransferase/synthase
VTQPLAGRRILVTRGASQASTLSDGLRALGGIPVEVPVLEIRPPASYEGLDTALARIDDYDWLILTSANAVRSFTNRAEQLGVELPRKAGLNVAAIGPATAKEARRMQLEVAIIPDSYEAESLVKALRERTAGKRVLLARAAVARELIPIALREAGATVDVVDAYQNALPDAAPEQLRLALNQPLDAATFTSSSSVKHLAEAARRAGIAFPLPEVPAISIGPITSQTLRDHSWPPAAEGDASEIPGLIRAVVRVIGG